MKLAKNERLRRSNLNGVTHSIRMEDTVASPARITQFQDISNESLVKRVLQGDTALFEVLMRRHNQRLYRIARVVLQDDDEAEDVMQDAYVKAYEHLHQFEGCASFSTWLSRIALYEALARARKRKRVVAMDTISDSEKETMHSLQSSAPSPEYEASTAEIRRLLEQEVDALPEDYRTIFVLRDVEDIDVAEVADILEISLANVKTRLHRAHALLRKRLLLRTGAQSREAFLFHARRCDRVVKAVFARLDFKTAP
jgi:RNA polymerase sigma-70 factor, ECF subfamily